MLQPAAVLILDDNTSSVCFVLRRMLQSRLQGDWQGSRSRHHQYPIPSADDVWKTKTGCLFRVRFYPMVGPHFRVGADPKTISENGSLKNHQFRVCTICEPVLQSENVHFRVQKRCYKRWPCVYHVKQAEVHDWL